MHFVFLLFKTLMRYQKTLTWLIDDLKRNESAYNAVADDALLHIYIPYYWVWQAPTRKPPRIKML